STRPTWACSTTRRTTLRTDGDFTMPSFTRERPSPTPSPLDGGIRAVRARRDAQRRDSIRALVARLADGGQIETVADLDLAESLVADGTIADVAGLWAVASAFKSYRPKLAQVKAARRAVDALPADADTRAEIAKLDAAMLPALEKFRAAK